MLGGGSSGGRFASGLNSVPMQPQKRGQRILLGTVAVVCVFACLCVFAGYSALSAAAGYSDTPSSASAAAFGGRSAARDGAGVAGVGNGRAPPAPAVAADAGTARAAELHALLAEKEAQLELQEFQMQRVASERAQLERRVRELAHEVETARANGADVGHVVDDHPLQPEDLTPLPLGQDPFLVWDNPEYRPAVDGYERLRDDPDVQRVYHLVSHTHWDREWYLPFETFRGRLVSLLDRIFDAISNGDETHFRHFHLDGQSIIADDFLEIHPQLRPLVQQFNTNGNISLGPWYVQPDEFLVSGEALVRNLLLGMRVARFFGGTSVVGYIPDSFGHIAQMPQILAGFGMSSAVSGRGVPGNAPVESVWRGADGTEVLFIYMKGWYCNALDMPAADSGALPNWFRSKTQQVTGRTKHILLMNGCDHSSPAVDVGRAIKAGAEQLSAQKEVVVHSNLDDYVSLVQHAIKPDMPKLPRYTGELRDSIGHLVNTLSNVIHQKQANTAIQQLLERWAEPLASVEWALDVLTRDDHLVVYPRDTLWYAWRLLMQNHPHDSICGCSADDVHTEVDARFRKVQQVVEQSVTLGISRMFHIQSPLMRALPSTGSARVIAFNPLGHPRREVVVAEIDRSMGIDFRVVSLHSKRTLPHTVMSSTHVWTYELPEIGFRKHSQVNRMRVAILVDLPAFGFTAMELVAGGGAKPQAQPAEETDEDSTVLENEFLKVTVHSNGLVDVVDKARNIRYEGQNVLEDCTDGGDQYHFQGGGGRVTLANGRITDTRSFATHQIAKIVTEMPFHRAKYPVTVHVVLRKASHRVEFRVQFENTVPDHRVRVLFGNGKGIHRVDSDSHFETISRQPNGFMPQLGYSSVVDGANSFTVANRGLPEFEISGHSYAMTLLRSTGRIGDWGHFPTPTAQELNRRFAFEYAFIPHSEDAGSSPYAATEARAFAEPCVAFESRDYLGYVPRALVDIVDHSDLELLVDTNPQYSAPLDASDASGDVVGDDGVSFFEVYPAQVVLSTIKKSDARESIIVRVYNPYGHAIDTTVSTSLQFSRVFLCRLDESRVRENPLVSVEGRPAYAFEIGPKKIVTLEFV
jgi:alpha-mannosidase